MPRPQAPPLRVDASKPIMLDFLSGAEELLLAEGNDSQTVYKLMPQAGREYGAMIVEEFMRRRIQ